MLDAISAGCSSQFSNDILYRCLESVWPLYQPAYAFFKILDAINDPIVGGTYGIKKNKDGDGTVHSC